MYQPTTAASAQRRADRQRLGAEPGGQVGAAQAVVDTGGDLGQQLVSGPVAETVVDRLEPVQIEEKHDQRAGVRVVEGPLQPFQEQRSVG